MTQRMWLICYDIRNAKRLRRVAKTMERYGVRVQKSVFECWLEDQRLAELREAVGKIMDDKEDGLRLYYLCEVCREQSEQLGGTPIATVKQFIIV